MIRRKPTNYTLKLAILIAVTAILALALIALVVVFVYKPKLDDTVPWTDTPTEQTKSPDPGKTDPSGNEYIRNQDITNFLVLGRDRVAYLTDVIMIVQFNTVDHSVNIMQIPRDTYANYGSNYFKINGLYQSRLVNNGYVEKYNGYDERKSMSEVVDFFQQNLNVKIDYYVLLNLDALVDVVNAIGGVEIDIASDMRYIDEDQNLYIDLKAGRQTLSGEQAEGFVRFRSGYLMADAGRVDAQKIFLSAFAKQFKKKVTVSNIDNIVSAVYKNILTDLSVADIIYYAKEALSVDFTKAKFISLPYGDARENVDSGQWYIILNRKATLDAINEYFNVYDKEVSDATFDAKRVLTNENKSHINEFYIAEEQSASVKTMENVLNDGIDIPVKN